MRYRSLFLTALLAVGSCNSPARKPGGSSGIDIAGMDRSVAPGDDFNAYANGRWAKATPIPADKSRIGSFSILMDDVRKELQKIVQETPGKIGDYYASYMDEGGWR